MSIFQALRRALATKAHQPSLTYMPSGHTLVHATRPFRHVPVIQKHYRGEPQLSEAADAPLVDRDFRDLDLEGDLLVIRRSLEGWRYHNSEVLKQVKEMYGASTETRWALKGVERTLKEETERKKASDLEKELHYYREWDKRRISDIRVSKAFSEQKLQAKRRHEPQDLVVMDKFEERHRRRLEAAKFLIKLGGPLDSIKAIAQAAGISSPDGAAISATDSSRKVESFFKINAINKASIEAYLKTDPSLTTYAPLFIPYNPARKSLSPHSLHPTLGIDSTLPHHRLQHLHDEPRPAQNEYPVWYFVYGDLADGGVFAELTGDSTRCEKAVTVGGRLNCQKGDGSLANIVEGRGFMVSIALQVETQEQEDMLRAYQAVAYEVVRCTIHIIGKDMEEAVQGLTFRLIQKAMD
ncbi:hypothetical protein F52700_5276 [Fusarium sp. NRRL 52700]|nr:hypothetical protein F52700_5276 [Fusarium sp. NRRL 52700]